MGTEGTRRRNRNRRLREKEMKSIPKPDKKRRDLIVTCIVFGITALLICKVELENMKLENYDDDKYSQLVSKVTTSFLVVILAPNALRQSMVAKISSL